MIIEDGTGVANANSYITRSAADAYFVEHPRSASWAALATTARDAYLVHATRMLDSAVTWKGQRADVQQSLEWPRVGVVVDNTDWPEDVIPADVKNAVCELAINNATSGLRDADTGYEGIASLGIGNGAVDISFDHTTTKDLLGKMAPVMIARFALSTSGRGVVKVVRR
jgi:hypothetical protein